MTENSIREKIDVLRMKVTRLAAELAAAEKERIALQADLEEMMAAKTAAKKRGDDAWYLAA